jgi:hypothetical protein
MFFATAVVKVSEKACAEKQEAEVVKNV